MVIVALLGMLMMVRDVTSFTPSTKSSMPTTTTTKQVVVTPSSSSSSSSSTSYTNNHFPLFMSDGEDELAGVCSSTCDGAGNCPACCLARCVHLGLPAVTKCEETHC